MLENIRMGNQMVKGHSLPPDSMQDLMNTC
jgi:hypothetical protein